MDSVEFAGDAAGPDAPEVIQPQGERPEGLPEKFNSVEDLAQSYAQLEQKMGGEVSESDEEYDQTPAEQVSEMIGAETFDKYSEEYFQNDGQLSEESYKELQESHNFSPDLVNSFIKGQEAVANNDLNEVTGVVGGTQQYENLMQWSVENLTESEQDAYNNTIINGDINSIKMALQGLHSRYAAEHGVEPSLIKGTSKGREGGYESKSQMISDMSKPEYQNDPAFRAAVERRLGNTPSGVI